MKRIVAILLVILLFLTACSNNNEPVDQGANNDKSQDSVGVDKGLLNTTVTFPAFYFENVDMKQVTADAKAVGVTDVIINDDGSVTYKMTKKVYNEMVEETQKNLDKYIEDIRSSEDYPSIKDVKHDNKYNEFTLIVDRSAYENGFDGIASLGLYMASMSYQLLFGVNPDENKITVHIEDEASGEVFKTNIYPDALEQMAQ